MPTIDSLSVAPDLYETDQIPLFSPAYNDTRKTTLGDLAEFVRVASMPEPDQTVYSLTITSTGFIASTLPLVRGASIWAQITLSGPASTGVIILPGFDGRAQDQEVLVTCNQSVASLIFNGDGAAVQGAPASLDANGFFKLRYDSISNRWIRVG